jgi:ATP-binding cassette, subfamily B, bacterial MsbA
VINWGRKLWHLATTLRRLFVRLHIGVGGLVVLFAVMVASTLLEGIGVGLLVPFFGLIITPDAPSSRIITWLHTQVPGQHPMVYIALFALAVIVALGLKNVFAYATADRTAHMQRITTTRLRAELYARMQQAPLPVYEQTSPGSLASLFGLEMQRAVAALGGTLALLQLVLMAVIYISALLWISVPLGLSAVVLGGTIAAIVHVYYRRLEHVGRDVTAANLSLSARLTETFAGVRTTRIAHAQEAEAARFRGINEVQAAAEERNLKGHAGLQPVVESLSVISAVLLIGGAQWLLVSRGRMSAQALIGFGLVLLRLVPLAKGFYATQGQVFYFAGGLEAIVGWLETPRFPVRPFGTAVASRLQHLIAVRGLRFSYNSGRAAITDISLDVPAHEFVAVVGRSGSGKSTLASLLLRLYEPDAGSIAVDGHDYWDFSEESWHRFVAFVDQDPFVFNDTISANVAYGYPAASPDDIVRALRVAQLDDFILALPKGLDTLLGERGVAMSGGQRQRLAIARAIVRDPQLLILDEATSHLDTISEAKLQRALVEAARGRTTLVIAHRLSTIKHANRIIVLHEGRIAEQGTWAELEAGHGVFQELLSHDLRDA